MREEVNGYAVTARVRQRASEARENRVTVISEVA